ncbi:MAG: hypothetical protein JXA81_03955 [Sedimentisphaerales bacterium]|nr:hypothetical protein [Sedimentisphaerales bacterium]
MKKIVARFNARGQQAFERVFVAAFGKHPGWDDHIDDIGLETDILVAVKRILYVQGIGGNIDSGNWEKLQDDQRLERFRHLFVWRMDDNLVVGRLWSSRDGKGRTSYPMVVCVQCRQLPLEWVFEHILPSLENIEKICVATTSPTEVKEALENAQTEFRRLIQQNPPITDLSVVPRDVLAKLAEYPEMGADHEGLLRILYHIEREITRYRPDASKGETVRPTLLRVSVSASTMLQNTLLWFGFLLNKLMKDTPVLVLMSLENSWIDIIIGEPTESQLYCLRASLRMIPLTSTIPYNMGSEFIARANKLIEESRGEETASS